VNSQVIIQAPESIRNLLRRPCNYTHPQIITADEEHTTAHSPNWVVFKTRGFAHPLPALFLVVSPLFFSVRVVVLCVCCGFRFVPNPQRLLEPINND
jgi:hypothetical protein